MKDHKSLEIQWNTFDNSRNPSDKGLHGPEHSPETGNTKYSRKYRELQIGF